MLRVEAERTEVGGAETDVLDDAVDVGEKAVEVNVAGMVVIMARLRLSRKAPSPVVQL